MLKIKSHASGAVVEKTARTIRQASRCFALLGALLLPFAASASESTDCLAPPADLDEALAREGDCHKNTDYLHAMGYLLNQAGRHGEAADRLEIAILLDPERWLAHFEYALALEGSGNHDSADALLVSLLNNPAVDTSIKHKITGLRRTPEVALARHAHTVVGLATGYDDNLQGATRYSRMDLTLPSGRLPVELAASSQPKKGSFSRVDAAHQGVLAHDALATWTYALVGSYRWAPSYADASIVHGGVMLERTPEGAAGYYALLALQGLRRGDGASQRQWQLAAGLETDTAWRDIRCRLRIGGEWQKLDYPGDPLFNGQYAGLAAHALCPAGRWQLQWRIGADAPARSERPGGRQQQMQVRLGKQTLLGEGLLVTEYEYYRQQDAKGFSPLLDYDTPRHYDRHSWRLEYRWVRPLAGRIISPYVGFEWIEQDANLRLFSLSNRIFSIGIRQTW